MEELKNSGGEEWQSIIADPDSMHGDVDIDAFADTVHGAFEKIIDENPGKKCCSVLSCDGNDVFPPKNAWIR
ncbi:MAG: hypothetical protein Ct9H90mP30_6770 [Actinomycetota bacterium]|nr:MAG: hypothetical protein Ct9H90mP30_6770 [Actinomycetota bacterium]